jgi:hypothetical protein
MTKYTLFVIIIALRLSFQPDLSQSQLSPFASPTTTTTIETATPARLLNVKAAVNNNKVVIDWTVLENETADQFEIEKSTDGKNFTMAALVFGTDKPATDYYQFYEKATNQKISYRIKLINKDKKTEYSTVVEVNPKA